MVRYSASFAVAKLVHIKTKLLVHFIVHLVHFIVHFFLNGRFAEFQSIKQFCLVSTSAGMAVGSAGGVPKGKNEPSD